MWQQWLNALLGLWVIALPFTGLTGDAMMWSLVVTGIAVSALAIWGATESQTETRMSWQS